MNQHEQSHIPISDLPKSEAEQGEQEESSQGAANDDPGGYSLISFFPKLQNYLWMTKLIRLALIG